MLHRKTTEYTDSYNHESRQSPVLFDLEKSLAKIAHWLPSQGPIKDFIHHNTLHAVQHLPFHEGVALAGTVFGARSYLSIADYQQEYRKGRILDHAIDWALNRTGLTNQQISQLKQQLFEEDHSSHYPPVSLANHGIRTAWLNHLEFELDLHVHPIIFRLLGNFLDQGISRWTLAKEGERFWDCVLRLTQNSLLPLYPFNEPAIRKLLTLPIEIVIEHCLDKIVGSPAQYEQYLLEMLLAHPGWSGMVNVIETNPRCLLYSRAISKKELIAVELLCELAFLIKHVGDKFPSISEIPLPEIIHQLDQGLPAIWPMLKNPVLKMIPAPFIVVLVGIGLAHYFDLKYEYMYLILPDAHFLPHHEETMEPKFLVAISENFMSGFCFPVFSKNAMLKFWEAVIGIGLVGGLERLLSAMAVYKLDPYKSHSNLDKDITAVGIGNLVSCLMGGLAMIAEIVRCSANVNNGAKTSRTNFFHGAF